MELRKHILQTSALACTLVIFSGTALAQRSAPGSEQVSSVAERSDTVTKSYGLQILAVDAAVIAATVATESNEVFIGGYLFGGPIVHVANGNGGKAIGSLLLRAGLPVGGMMLGAAAADCDGADAEFLCGLGEVAVGLLAGMVTATVIDAAVLARKDIPVDDRPPALLRYGGVAANPDVAVTKHGSFTFGLTGSF